MAEPLTICITGAAGHIGRLIVPVFATAGHELVLLDRVSQGPVRAFDLSVWTPELVDALRGCDVVLHLAGVAQPWADWDAVIAGNVDGLLNIATAAALASVRRFVFASSNWVVAGARGVASSLSAETPPAPVNAYGASKLFGERMVKHLCEVHAMEGVCLRIGYSQHRDDDTPGPHMAQGLWGQRMWVSRRDLTQILLSAATAALPAPYAVANAVSDNAGMAWDLAGLKRVLGYTPVDRSVPEASPALEQQEASVLDARRAIEAIERLLTLRRW
jgi:NAD+ dependent glucose-6-phosphate dehydrogenase